jgi:hypothetical protein
MPREGKSLRSGSARGGSRVFDEAGSRVDLQTTPSNTASPAERAKSWRDVLPVHPAAELFPLMSPDELRELGEDIKKNGPASPPVLWAMAGDRYALIDGRNRLDAMEAVGILHIDPETDDLVFTSPGGQQTLLPLETLGHCPLDPYDYVLSANAHRRHLTAEQKRELIAKVLKAQPEKSNRQVAKLVGRSHTHVAKMRGELEETGDVATVATSIDTKGRKQPAKKKRRDVDDFLAEKRAREDDRRAEENRRETIVRLTEAAYRGTVAWAVDAFADDVRALRRDDAFRRLLIGRVRFDPSTLSDIQRGAKTLADVLSSFASDDEAVRKVLADVIASDDSGAAP